MATQSMRTARSPVLATTATVVALTVVGCASGADRPRADQSSTPSASASDLDSVRVLYRYEERIDGQRSRIDWEVVTGQAHRIRATITGGFNTDGPAIGTYFVYDGKVLLTYEPDGNPKYYLTNHPAKSDMPPALVVARPDSKALARLCPKAQRRHKETIRGRSAVSYTCAPTAVQKEEGASVDLVVDSATGLVLRAGPLTVRQLEFNPPTTAATFSTALPDNRGYQPLKTFRVPRVGGGQLALNDYRGRPLVVITGHAAGIRTLAARLATPTDHGQAPPVIALLIAIPPDNWNGSLLNPDDVSALATTISRQVGDLGIPTGIDFKGAAGRSISLPAGISPQESRPAAVGFIRSDGTLVKVLTERASTAQLAQQVARLH